MTQRESVLVTRFIKRIRELSVPSHARKVHGSPYQDAGEPDIDAVVDGVPLKLEVKVPGGKVTRIQEHALDRWERAGAVVGVVTSDEELDAAVAECLQRCTP